MNESYQLVFGKENGQRQIITSDSQIYNSYVCIQKSICFRTQIKLTNKGLTSKVLKDEILIDP